MWSMRQWAWSPIFLCCPESGPRNLFFDTGTGSDTPARRAPLRLYHQSQTDATPSSPWSTLHTVGSVRPMIERISGVALASRAKTVGAFAAEVANHSLMPVQAVGGVMSEANTWAMPSKSPLTLACSPSTVLPEAKCAVMKWNSSPPALLHVSTAFRAPLDLPPILSLAPMYVRYSRRVSLKASRFQKSATPAQSAPALPDLSAIFRAVDGRLGAKATPAANKCLR
mmetsp:Transcript_54921/g.163520  ORF Transcript_54921/g.163520 Transcript_54921/m.163520 type:complete len:226 (-) Transcript_54921:662-1339(-)